MQTINDQPRPTCQMQLGGLVGKIPENPTVHRSANTLRGSPTPDLGGKKTASAALGFGAEMPRFISGSILFTLGIMLYLIVGYHYPMKLFPTNNPFNPSGTKPNL